VGLTALAFCSCFLIFSNSSFIAVAGVLVGELLVEAVGAGAEAGGLGTGSAALPLPLSAFFGSSTSSLTSALAGAGVEAGWEADVAAGGWGVSTFAGSCLTGVVGEGGVAAEMVLLEAVAMDALLEVEAEVEVEVEGEDSLLTAAVFLVVLVVGVGGAADSALTFLVEDRVLLTVGVGGAGAGV